MSIGRPVQFDADSVLDAAMHAFWARGYEATSMQDLLSTTCLSKSSLYQAFGSKQALFGKCLDRYTDQMVVQLRERLEGSSPLAFIRATLLDIASEGAVTRSPRGCLIMNTATEFGQRDPVFAGWVDVGLARIRAVMAEAIKRGRRQREVTTAHSSVVLADYLMAGIAGLRAMVKAGTRPSHCNAVVDVVVGALAAHP